MNFTEWRFLGFLGLVLAVYWSLRNNALRKLWLLLCSCAFYAAWDWRFLFLILGTTLVDYLAGAGMGRARSLGGRKALLALSLGVNLGVLGFFKYCNFFVASAAGFSRLMGFPLQARFLSLALPLGISYHAFMAMSCTIDVYRRKIEPASSPLDFFLHILFFPRLVAGPIARASEFLPELGEAKLWGNVDVRGCLVLFMIGLFKKSCLSDNISPSIDAYFAHPAQYGAAGAWLSVLLYSLQIYCDFSGYTDMAIASAGLLGYPLARNFDFPYFSENVADFWNRWHMSLTRWLRDYVFIPLQCVLHDDWDIRSRWGLAASLILTMALCGLWHGAAWNFVLWGVVHGIALAAYGAAPLRRLKLPRRLATVLGIGATYFFTTFCGLVLFRSTSFQNILLTFQELYLFRSPGSTALPIGLFSIFFAAAAVHAVSYSGRLDGWYRRLPPEAFYFLAGGAAALIFALAPFDYAPFIYVGF